MIVIVIAARLEQEPKIARITTFGLPRVCMVFCAFWEVIFMWFFCCCFFCLFFVVGGGGFFLLFFFVCFFFFLGGGLVVFCLLLFLFWFGLVFFFGGGETAQSVERAISPEEVMGSIPALYLSGRCL